MQKPPTVCRRFCIQPMTSVSQLTQAVRHVQHGFKEMRTEADKILLAKPALESLSIAERLLESEYHQVRMVAVFVLGGLAADSRRALKALRTRVAVDPDWRVQEILAQAFDRFCADTGYEATLPTIEDWLADSNPNVRRAVSEGLRIWTSRDYFRQHPAKAIALLSSLRGDESEYVRKSVGNALRDISRKHVALVRAELNTWDTDDARVAQTHQLAARFLP